MSATTPGGPYLGSGNMFGEEIELAPLGGVSAGEFGFRIAAAAQPGFEVGDVMAQLPVSLSDREGSGAGAVAVA